MASFPRPNPQGQRPPQPINASVGQAKDAGTFGYTSIDNGWNGTPQSGVNASGIRVPFVNGKSPERVAQEKAAATQGAPRQVPGLLHPQYDTSGRLVGGIDEKTGEQVTLQNGRLVPNGKPNAALVKQIKSGANAPAQPQTQTQNPAAAAAAPAVATPSQTATPAAPAAPAAPATSAPATPQQPAAAPAQPAPAAAAPAAAPAPAAPVIPAPTAAPASGYPAPQGLPHDVAVTARAQEQATPPPLSPPTPGPTPAITAQILGQANVSQQLQGSQDAQAAADAAYQRQHPGPPDAAHGGYGMLPVAPGQGGQTYVGDGSMTFNGKVLPAGQSVTLLPGGKTVYSQTPTASAPPAASASNDTTAKPPTPNQPISAPASLGPLNFPAPQRPILNPNPGEVDPTTNVSLANPSFGLGTGTDAPAANGLNFKPPAPLANPLGGNLMKPEDFASPSTAGSTPKTPDPQPAGGFGDNDYSGGGTGPKFPAPTTANLFTGTGYTTPPSQVEDMQKQTQKDVSDEEDETRRKMAGPQS